MPSRNNQNFKYLRGALALDRKAVVECMRMGGLDIGADRVRRWLSHPSEGAQRHTAMADAEFDAFCAGLSLYMSRERQDSSV